MRALIAEDNASFRQVLERMLVKWKYEVELASDGNHAWEILNGDDPPRLALLDWMMPGMDGVEICRRIRAQPKEPYIYILLLTAKDSEEELVEGMEAGADDYLIKPVKSQELRVRLRAGRRILDLQEELIRAREALRLQATRDALTEMWNRGAMFEILTREIKRSKRESTPLSVIMADLDHFKQVNDNLGHAAGDAVLREAARRMVCCIRPYDSACRYGGEEFLIVLPGCDLDGAIARAETIRRTIAAEPFRLREGSLDVTCSLGVASTTGPDGIEVDCVLHEADEALYQAKHNGRNRVEAFVHQDVVLSR